MGWESALRDAELPLPKPIKGEYINLDDFADTLDTQGNYRILVLRAAKRLLEKRGANVRFTTPPGQAGLLDEL